MNLDGQLADCHLRAVLDSPCCRALALLANDSNMPVLQVLPRGGGAPGRCPLAFASAANIILSPVVQSKMLPNS